MPAGPVPLAARAAARTAWSSVRSRAAAPRRVGRPQPRASRHGRSPPADATTRGSCPSPARRSSPAGQRPAASPPAAAAPADACRARARRASLTALTETRTRRRGVRTRRRLPGHTRTRRRPPGTSTRATRIARRVIAAGVCAMPARAFRASCSHGKTPFENREPRRFGSHFFQKSRSERCAGL